MKVYHSPPFGLNSDNATAGCLAGILRRLLCGSFRDRGVRDSDENRHAQKLEQKKMASPGIVARLMGLDSMPVFPYTPPDSLKRSRSANSAESWSGFVSSERSQGVQIRTSLSFREAPTYLRPENEEFLLLSFSPEDGEGSFVCNGKKAARIPQEMKQSNVCTGNDLTREKMKRENRIGESWKKRNHKHNLQKENLTERSQSDVNDLFTSSATTDAHRRSSRIARINNYVVKSEKYKEMPTPLEAQAKLASARGDVETDQCSSQDSSPVSVLDHPHIDGECPDDSSSPTSGEEVETVRQHSPRRKLSSSKFEDVNCTSPTYRLDAQSREGRKKPIDGQSMKSSKIEQVTVDCTQIWGKICMLTEEDLKSTTWISKEICKLEEFETAAVIAMDILDLLLQDAVEEMSGCNGHP